MITKFARLEFELFTKPSKSDFLRVPLRCILRHCGVLEVRLIPKDLRALNFYDTIKF
ncbi:MAG: hypothetical protein JRC55_07725 [Deltaproteobacteria bacterium]|nr:hypothetical protein [Deltaproteobacteria bacterium]